MTTIKRLHAISALSLLLTGTAFGATYTDATGDMLPATVGFTHCDITSVVITNDATNISFKIIVAGDPIAVNWGEYNIGIDTASGVGQTTGLTPPNRPINMSTGGMDYWIRSWDTGAEVYHWETTYWYGDFFTWNPPSDIQVPVKTTNSITLTTTLSSLHLSSGQTFKFDVTSCGGTGTDSAWDALANPNPTAASGNYTNEYDSLTNVYSYTVTGPAASNTVGAAYTDTKGDMLPATLPNPHCDIVAFDITNDASNITFKFYLAADPIATSWGEYNIGIDSIAGGDVTGPVPPTRPITMSVGGMDYWIRSWDTGAEVYNWSGTFWNGEAQTYNPPSAIQLPVKTTNSVALTTTLASLGLSAGQSFKFDAYTAGGTGTDSAWDALANPNATAASGNYTNAYDSGTNVYTYTVKGSGPLVPIISNPHYAGTTFTANVPTQLGFSYALEYKTVITNASWSTVQTSAGTGATITLTNAAAAGNVGFYRVRAQ